MKKFFNQTFKEIANNIMFCLESLKLMTPMKILPTIGEHVSKSK